MFRPSQKGFCAEPYVETLLVDRLHIGTPCSLIAREVYRRVHRGEIQPRDKKRTLADMSRREQRDACKQMIRYCLERHLANRAEYYDVMYPHTRAAGA